MVTVVPGLRPSSGLLASAMRPFLALSDSIVVSAPIDAAGSACVLVAVKPLLKVLIDAILLFAEPSGDRDVDEVTLASSSDSLRSALLSSSSATRSFSCAISPSLLALARLCSERRRSSRRRLAVFSRLAIVFLVSLSCCCVRLTSCRAVYISERILSSLRFSLARASRSLFRLPSSALICSFAAVSSACTATVACLAFWVAACCSASLPLLTKKRPAVAMAARTANIRSIMDRLFILFYGRVDKII